MKRIITTLIICANISLLNAQVGIGTNTPNASAMLEVTATDKGILFPRMTSVQRTSIASPASGLYVFDTNTNSLWYYNGTLWINTTAEASFGDVKSGFQTADHSGWIKLDGRAVSTLTPNQQAVAISLGFTTNLPDATTAYLVQDNGTMGAISGSNTTTLVQANLPNVNFTGTAANAGNHAHAVDPAAVSTSSSGNHNHVTDPAAVTTSSNGNHSHTMSFQNDDYNGAGGGSTGLEDDSGNFYNRSTSANGNHNHTVDIPATTSTTAGAHTHTIDVPSTTSTTNGAHTHSVTVASGGTAAPVDISPKSLTVNMFVYLGQ